MVHAYGDYRANPCILLKSLLTNALERSGNFHLIHTHMYLHCTAELESQRLYSVVIRLIKNFRSCPYQVQTNLSVSFSRSFSSLLHLTGCNTVYGDTFKKQYSDQDWLCADVICHFRCESRSTQLLWSKQVQMSEMLCVPFALSFPCHCFICTPSVEGKKL